MRFQVTLKDSDGLYIKVRSVAIERLKQLNTQTDDTWILIDEEMRKVDQFLSR
jgi:hypothetical protein